MILHDERCRLIGGIPPAKDTWALYYDADIQKIVAVPVAYFALWEFRRDGDGKCFLESYPVTLPCPGDLALDEERGRIDFLGLSFTPEPDTAVWEEQIKRFWKRKESRTRRNRVLGE